MSTVTIGNHEIGPGQPVYFVADIAANHDGDLERAKVLIHMAADAGVGAAKFQHFQADKIVSKVGFEGLGDRLSHQAAWGKSVYEVYEDASIPQEWTRELRNECRDAGIAFFSAPYDTQSVADIYNYTDAYKIGSGDITWIEHIKHITEQGKPVILSTGAASLRDVARAMVAILSVQQNLFDESKVILLQCNTNYTGSSDNFRYVNLKAMASYANYWPGVPLGLSDHTPGYAAVLGAVALGASMIEKHLTDDCTRDGPDHAFSLTPVEWREMVDCTRELELALGDGFKQVELNEQDTVVLQQRCLRTNQCLITGTVLTREHIDVLRPAPSGSLPPYEIGNVLGRILQCDLEAGHAIYWEHLA